MATGQVQAALHALYHSPDPAVRQQANQWLSQWQQSAEAWEGAVAVLRSADSAPEVQVLTHFAAQTLRAKAQRDHEQLSAAAMQGLQVSLVLLVSRFAPGPTAVRMQLCLALAALAARQPDADAAGSLALQARAMLNSMPALGLTLLAALPEPLDTLARAQRTVLARGLLQQAGEVLSAVGQVLQQCLQSQGGSNRDAATSEAAVAALQCIEAWALLSPQPGGSCAFTPAELQGSQPALFDAMAAAALAEDGNGSVAEAAAQALCSLFGSSTFRGDDGVDALAVSRVCALLAPLRLRLASVPACIALGVAQIGSAMAERSPEAACGRGVPEAAQFAELMLGCLSRPELPVAEAALDYFLMVNTVPLAERLPQLGPPLFEAAVGRLLRHAAYPRGFTAWEDVAGDGPDGDEFDRFRDSVAPELLEVAYGLLRCAYLEQACRLLEGAQAWQDAEAALFLVGSVALPLRARALVESGGAVGQDAARTGELLAGLFARVLEPGAAAAALGAHPALARTLCWALERFAPWFARREEAPVAAALQCTLRALRVAGADGAGATAFQALCLRCAPRLRAPDAVHSLVAAAHEAMATSALSLDGQRAVVEGLARVAGGLPAASARAVAVQLTQPFLEQARAAAEAGAAPSPQARQGVAQGLWLLAAALRFLMPLGEGGGAGSAGSSSDDNGPALGVLRSADAVLAAVAQSPQWQHDADAAAALIEVYKQAVCSARAAGKELLPRVLPAVGAVFAATALPACLDVLAEALEVHFPDAGVVQALLSALGAACAVAFPLLEGPSLRERGDLAAALLALGDAFAVYAPAALWTAPLLQPLLSLATAAATLREADPARRALSLLCHVASTHQRAADDGAVGQSHMEAAHAAVLAQGERVTLALLCALCDTCPRQHMRAAADCLRALLLHPVLAPHAARWLASACASSELRSAAEGRVSEDDCRRVCALVAGGLRGARLVAMLVDFGLVARGQNTRDVLLAYEL